MSYKTIILEQKDYIATIILNRPESLNALNTQMVDELSDAFASADDDNEIRVVVITGAGWAFCSGADLTEERGKTRSGSKGGFSDKIFAALSIDKPVIASVNGVAVGGGCTITLSCDIRIASENARFQLPFTRLGVCAEGLTYLLPRLVGMGKACELLFTSKMINAEEAKEIGLVNEVVPANELEKATYEMANSIAKLPPLSVQMNKRGLRQGMNTDVAIHMQYESLANVYLHNTEDHKEAIRAFKEKREPIYKGR